MSTLQRRMIIFLPIYQTAQCQTRKTVIASASSIRMCPLYYVIYIVEILQTESSDAGFEVPTVVTMKSGVIWVVSLCSSETAKCFGGTYHFYLQCRTVS
jgi:hypothetical protein